jgi:hypothetical protein
MYTFQDRTTTVSSDIYFSPKEFAESFVHHLLKSANFLEGVDGCIFTAISYLYINDNLLGQFILLIEQNRTDELEEYLREMLRKRNPPYKIGNFNAYEYRQFRRFTGSFLKRSFIIC